MHLVAALVQAVLRLYICTSLKRCSGEYFSLIRATETIDNVMNSTNCKWRRKEPHMLRLVYLMRGSTDSCASLMGIQLFFSTCRPLILPAIGNIPMCRRLSCFKPQNDIRVIKDQLSPKYSSLASAKLINLCFAAPTFVEG